MTGAPHALDVIVEAVEGLNTLIDYRYLQHYKAERGVHGMGANRTGSDAPTLVLKVPVGTQVFEEDQETLIADLDKLGDKVLLAKGGSGGWGNTKFKSSTNQAPRRADPGWPGAERWIWLRLKLIADAGLLGMPNAGKSTLIRAVSSARPKVADYPFTTLHPNLGVVRVGPLKSFVMADIPGLIEGAAEGAGLGVQFLKHLARTSLLLHLVDLSPYSDSGDPVADVRTIEAELAKYSAELAGRERWLVLNKLDLLPEDEREARAQAVVEALGWSGPVFRIAAIGAEGTEPLCWRIMERLDAARAAMAASGTAAAPAADAGGEDA